MEEKRNKGKGVVATIFALSSLTKPLFNKGLVSHNRQLRGNLDVKAKLAKS